MDMMQIALIGGGTLVFLLLVIFAFSGPSQAAAQAKRLDKVKFRHSDSTNVQVEAQMKKALSARKKHLRPAGENMTRLEALAVRLDRTGKEWELRKYFMICGGIMVALTALLFLNGAPFFLCLFVGLAAGFGIPHFVVGFMISRRVNKFNIMFPDAIELLVRGLRSGLPVTETIGVVANEIEGPVGEENSQKLSTGSRLAVLWKMLCKRVRSAWTHPNSSFSCITIAIQRETGGNLAETLSNLADVLRKRAQMKLKIKAMSSESKAICLYCRFPSIHRVWFWSTRSTPVILAVFSTRNA